MGRHTFRQADLLSAENQARGLRHARDAVARSAWVLALLHKDLGKARATSQIQRLQIRNVLADLGSRQASLSEDYFAMATTPANEFMGMPLRDFFVAYDRFLDAVGAARADYRGGCDAEIRH